VLACLGVSPRTSREAEAVRRGAEAFHVALRLSGPAGDHRREIGYAPGRGRRLAIDGRPERSLGAWRERGAVLVFLPDELRAVKGPPAARRRHLDRLLEAAEPGYAEALAGYQAALAQRNALLRRVRAAQASEAGLAPWEAAMAERGARVAVARRRAVADLGPEFAHWLAALGGGAGGTLALEPSPSGLDDVADGEMEAALAEALRARRPAEVRAGQTLAGPHRDDVRVEAEGADLRHVGSQGEQRTAVLALLLAHRKRLVAVSARPLLLLDDVLSELDPDRRAALLGTLVGAGQAILTTADPTAASAASGAGALLRVGEGRVTPA
jgi:DNA replication and repair protein RecF